MESRLHGEDTTRRGDYTERSLHGEGITWKRDYIERGEAYIKRGIHREETYMKKGHARRKTHREETTQNRGIREETQRSFHELSRYFWVRLLKVCPPPC